MEVVKRGVLPPVEVTVEELTAGVNQYTTLALNHYYPDPAEEGLSPDDWADASYACAFLLPDQTFALY